MAAITWGAAAHCLGDGGCELAKRRSHSTLLASVSSSLCQEVHNDNYRMISRSHPLQSWSRCARRNAFRTGREGEKSCTRKRKGHSFAGLARSRARPRTSSNAARMRLCAGKRSATMRACPLSPSSAVTAGGAASPRIGRGSRGPLYLHRVIKAERTKPRKSTRVPSRPPPLQAPSCRPGSALGRRPSRLRPSPPATPDMQSSVACRRRLASGVGATKRARQRARFVHTPGSDLSIQLRLRASKRAVPR